MNKPAPLSQRQYDYFLRCFHSWFNVAEGGKRGGKNVLATLIFCSMLEIHKNKIHLVAGVSVATAKLNILDCDGYGLLNYFEGRCTPGKYNDRDCVYVQTKTGQKIVLVSGGGKDGDEKLIKGNTYGMAYVTEANECHPKFLKEVFDRTLSSFDRKIFHDLNPKEEEHWYYTDILKFHEEQQEANPKYGYNYGHFTIVDNMSLSDEQIMGLYQDLEDEVIADIARRVKKTGRYTETAELMAKSMVEQGYSAEKIQAEVMKMLRADTTYRMAVAENTAAYKQEVQDIINQTVKEAKAAGNKLVAEAGNMAWNNDLSMWQEHGVDLKQPNSMSQLLTAFQAQTTGELKNLTRTMGFKNTVFGTTGVLNAYQREMDLALLKVATGAFSYDQAVNDCVHRLAQSGLRSIDYESGRSYQLDTAARMCVRTGLSQLSGKIMEANLAQTGQDLVITSQHMGSRPEHVPWQNKVFSYSGKNKKYPDFIKETGYGTATGLKGVNCTHDFYPFWEGASVIPDDLEESAPVNINGKEYTYYQVSQQQRKMERDIRATKREIEAQRAIGGDTAELQSKLRKQTSDYKQFSAAAGVKVKNNRLRVETGSSDIKHTAAYARVNKSISKSQDRFDILESYRKGNTHRKSVDGIEIIDEATYNKLIWNAKRNGGVIIRGTSEVEEHLAKNGSTASCIGDVLLFSKNATVSDVLEETYHFNQNLKKMNHNKPAKERLLLNEIDAQNYLLSVADKYHIPESELEVTRKNLADYEKALEEYYENLR